jgi:hypothetical protein
MNKFIVVSYYTKGTGYEKEAMKLELSLMNYNIPYHIAAVPNLRSWQKNTHFKAIFIRNMLIEFVDVNLVFTDADSIFHCYPKLFEDLDCDIAVHFRDWKHARNELLSGTIYLANNARIRRLVDDWIRINNKQPANWDQRNLQRAVNRHKHNLEIYSLPMEYCCIFDDEKRTMCDPVVEHFQKSRDYRREIGR